MFAELLPLVPVVLGLTEVLKRAFKIKSDFVPLLSVAFGLLGAFAAVPSLMLWREIVLGGVIIGLMASGLYDNLKPPAEGVVRLIKGE